MTVSDQENQLVAQLIRLYDAREASNIADLIIENVTGLKKMDRMLNKTRSLSADQENQLIKYSAQLLREAPVQYVLHESWFFGQKFYVDESTLIPRPETEELVAWVVEDFGQLKNKREPAVKILEVGSGSGCIPIIIKKKLPGAELISCDISEAALQVAKKNSKDHGVTIDFLQLDFLDRNAWSRIPTVQCIVSNPPYVSAKEKASMRPNVLKYEPEQALFVPNEDPLIFYRAIGEFAREKLAHSGQIYVEINEHLGQESASLFSTQGFSRIEIKKDMQGKDRMIKATWLL